MKELSKADILGNRDDKYSCELSRISRVQDDYRLWCIQKVPYGFGRKYKVSDTEVVYTKENETADAYIAELTKI